MSNDVWLRPILITAMLAALAASGCSLVIDPSDYENPGIAQPDGALQDAALRDAALQDAPNGCSNCDAGSGGIPDAMCVPAEHITVDITNCRNMDGVLVPPTVQLFSSDNADGEQVHLVSVKQESQQDSSIIVTVRVPGVHSLVLSASEPVTWLVTETASADVRKVYLVGDQQGLDGDLGPMEIERLPLTGSASCGYQPPSTPGAECNTDLHISSVGQLLAPLQVSSHAGCYQTQRVEIAHSCPNSL